MHQALTWNQLKDSNDFDLGDLDGEFNLDDMDLGDDLDLDNDLLGMLLHRKWT